MQLWMEINVVTLHKVVEAMPQQMCKCARQCVNIHTNPISIIVGTLSKNAIKTKICNVFIHLNLY